MLALLVLVLAAGACCLLDADHHHHDGAGVDVCTSIALVGLTAPLSGILVLLGMSAEQRAWAATPAAVSIPDPPPWR